MERPSLSDLNFLYLCHILPRDVNGIFRAEPGKRSGAFDRRKVICYRGAVIAGKGG
jgi:hypothetical protein